MTPPWITEALKHVGVREIPGEKHHAKILQWWRAIRRSGIRSDEIPWCAAFVGGCLEACAIESTRFEGARSYVEWGEFIGRPQYGCVVVFKRPGGYHVGFVVGLDEDDNLLVLGGNQANEVNIRAFGRDRVIAYRMPKGWSGKCDPLQVAQKPYLLSQNET